MGTATPAVHSRASRPFLELRAFLEHLEASGRLHRVCKPVDKDWELACIARWALECTAEVDAYAILFEKIRNHTQSVVVNLYPNAESYAAALGTTSDALLQCWSTAMQCPLKPVLVGSAPAQQVLHKDSDVNLLALPAPVWTPGLDAGPYLSAASVITKDPETGVQNVGIYRMQIHDATHAGLAFASKSQHGAIHLEKYAKLGEPMPIAAIVGAPPAVTFASAAKVVYGFDELGIAGALSGTPLEVVRASTVDLLVPAWAELVIEGYVRPEASRTEGPFGEVLGYLSDAAPAAVVEVTAITHRCQPVHCGFVQQLPPSDGHLVMELGALGPLWFYLTRKFGLQGIRNMAIARGSAAFSVLIVQIDDRQTVDICRAAQAIARFGLGQKFIYFVDQDVDIRDTETINWVLSTRVDPQRDIHFIDNVRTFQSDPSTMARAAEQEKEPGTPPYDSSIAVVNATLRCAAPKVCLPEAALMKRTRSEWEQTGLPALNTRKRLERLLDIYR